MAETARAPKRVDGYAPIGDYAALGDGRTVALVALDGSIDWLCTPDVDSSSLFAALLDTERGGRFSLAPDEPFEADRAYVPDTNVLETTFRSAQGTVRITDALIAGSQLLVRRVQGLAGSVVVEWLLEPRPQYARGRCELVATEYGVDLQAEQPLRLTTEGGHPTAHAEEARASFVVEQGDDVALALSADQDPGDVREALERDVARWRRWASGRYDGPWRDAVLRSGLVLKLLQHRPTGAMVAAPTTSLPETIGGERNWDYRYSWVRDSTFALDALLALACPDETDSFAEWLIGSTRADHPQVKPLYTVAGDSRIAEDQLGLAGYRGSRPVRCGNAASEQFQLDAYGALLQTMWQYDARQRALDVDACERMAELADAICACWRQPDAGIWEVRSEEQHFTHSKMAAWVALQCAVRLAQQGRLPTANASRWRAQAEELREFVDRRCWSEARQAWTRAAGSDDLDASVLLAGYLGYADADDPRLASTVDAVRAELAEGVLVRRYRVADGLPGEEGAFVACSFWLADALALIGRIDEAAEVFEGTLARANDVGLFAEEVDPRDGTLLGNFPQGLAHLSLICAAKRLSAFA